MPGLPSRMIPSRRGRKRCVGLLKAHSQSRRDRLSGESPGYEPRTRAATRSTGPGKIDRRAREAIRRVVERGLSSKSDTRSHGWEGRRIHDWVNEQRSKPPVDQQRQSRATTVLVAVSISDTVLEKVTIRKYDPRLNGTSAPSNPNGSIVGSVDEETRSKSCTSAPLMPVLAPRCQKGHKQVALVFYRPVTAVNVVGSISKWSGRSK
jgi:hypothetical protein